MADVNEQMDAMLGSSYVDDTNAPMPSAFEKMQRRLDTSDKTNTEMFTDKDDADEKLQSTVTGMAVGSAAIPSDAITMASEASKFVNKDPMLSTMFPVTSNVSPYLEEVNKLAGRPGFEELIKALGIKSDPTNTNQIVGEILSPSFYFPAFKGAVKLSKAAGKAFDDLGDIFKGGDGTGGAKLAAESATSSNVGKASQIDDFNQPTINLSEAGIKAPDGARAATIYEKLEADAMGGVYTKENGSELYAKLSLDEKDRLFKETGVYRGLEGKLRYKIPTGDAQLNQGYLRDLGVIEDGVVPVFNTSKLPKEGLSIKEILNFQDLYRNYGSIKSNGDYGLLENIKVKSFDSYIKEMGLGKEAMTDLKNTQAIYSRHEGVETIYIKSGKNIKATKDDILHEIQHAIQHREGFIAGSSPEAFLNGKTQFGKDYQANINSTFYEKRAAFTQLEKRVGDDGKRIFAPFLDDKDLFESVTNKLVKREYEKILKGAANNKPNNVKYFATPGGDVSFLQTRDLLVDPPSFVRNEMKPMEYKGYDGDKITFNEKEADLANALSNKVSFQDYVRQRIILENNVRNQKLMEAEAHQMYLDVSGEVQARKIVEDNDLYRIAKDKMGYKPNETVPKEVQEEIFRQIKPSKTGLLEGQTIKPQGSNVDIST